MAAVIGLAFGYFVWMRRRSKVEIADKLNKEPREWPTMPNDESRGVQQTTRSSITSNEASATASPAGPWEWPSMPNDESCNVHQTTRSSSRSDEASATASPAGPWEWPSMPSDESCGVHQTTRSSSKSNEASASVANQALIAVRPSSADVSAMTGDFKEILKNLVPVKLGLGEFAAMEIHAVSKFYPQQPVAIRGPDSVNQGVVSRSVPSISRESL